VPAASIGGVELINLGLGGSALLDPFTARALRDTPGLPLPDQLHPDAAAHRRIGERFAAPAFGTGGPFTGERA
jgi:hypothetical protein